MSSPWTLVASSVFGTVVTAAVYLGGIVLLWWLFERGTGLTASWLATEPEAAWQRLEDWLPAIRIAGHVLFAAAMIGVIGALLRDIVARKMRVKSFVGN